MTVTEILNSNFSEQNYCVHIDRSLDSVFNLKNTSIDNLTEPNLVISPLLIVGSVISLLIGAKIFKFVAGMISSISVFYIIYKLSDNSSGISCDIRILVSSIIGLIAGFITGCMINFALFVLGALSLMSFVHLIFSAFPDLHSVNDTALIYDKSLLYWGCILVSGIVGGFVFRWNKIFALEITTSVIGGIGLSIGIYGIVEITNTEIVSSVYFGIAIGAAFIGILIQRKLRKKKLCGRSTENVEITTRQ